MDIYGMKEIIPELPHVIVYHVTPDGKTLYSCSKCHATFTAEELVDMYGTSVLSPSDRERFEKKQIETDGLSKMNGYALMPEVGKEKYE